MLSDRHKMQPNDWWWTWPDLTYQQCQRISCPLTVSSHLSRPVSSPSTVGGWLAGRRRSKSTLMTATPTNGHFTTPSRRRMNHTIDVAQLGTKEPKCLPRSQGVSTLFYQLNMMFSIEEGNCPILLFMSVNNLLFLVAANISRITYISTIHIL